MPAFDFRPGKARTQRFSRITPERRDRVVAVDGAAHRLLEAVADVAHRGVPLVGGLESVDLALENADDHQGHHHADVAGKPMISRPPILKTASLLELTDAKSTLI
ncbi:hypothetical protein [uncultured Methylobacterium sp.]|uniref:hypothetical protein n=1 Tax=uncultured Methylobacterium sp. TaxID=157278 RepID=UPI0035CAB702